MMTPAPRPTLVLLADAAAEIICSGLGGAAAMPTPTQLRERLDELDAVAAKGGVAAR